MQGKRAKDEVGKVYGRWTVLERVENHGRNGTFLCRCECGTERAVQGRGLRSGKSQSCGCLHAELQRASAAVWRTGAYKEAPGYQAVHQRLRVEKGRASEHECVDCNGQGADWSYRGGDPDELTEVLRYSTDLDYYEPRCRDCHVKYDGGAK